LVTKLIDTALVEYTDHGEQFKRSPRQWAKSLTNSEGASLEIDMETGTSDGNASLIIPSIHLAQAKIELHNYCQRQNPSLLNAERFY
jgi:hypothetical protein